MGFRFNPITGQLDLVSSGGGSGVGNASVTVAAFGSTLPADFVCASAAGNQVEINQAIVAANALPTGGVVYLRAGNYVVSGNGIVPLSNVTLVGEFGATILRHDGSASSYTGIGIRPVIHDNGSPFDNFGVENLTFIGNNASSSTSCSIYLTGSNDPDSPGAPIISNFFMHNVTIKDNTSLPIRLFGLSGKLNVLACEFNHNADAGFGWNEEVIFMSNHSIDSKDNGFSISRGNQKVICVGNTVENPTFWGIWLSGFSNELGPTELVCNGNVVINSKNSGIGLKGSPSKGSICGNYIDQNHNRPSNSDIDGIQIYGDSSILRASQLAVSGNTIINAARAGISVSDADNVSITGNLILDPGTQFFADGTTPILSSDTTTNAGVLSTHLSNNNIWVDGNAIYDTRTIPFCNWDIWKIQSTASGLVSGTNYSLGMRNQRNSLELINIPVEAGNPVVLDVNGPDTNIDVQLNIQGAGQFIVHAANGGGVNSETAAVGTNAQSVYRMSAGAASTPIGQLTSTRIDASTSSIVALSPLQNGSLASVTTGAPFYVQGSDSASNAWIGLKAGIAFKRTTVSDVGYTVSRGDYIVAYITLTSTHTVTLPDATLLAGRSYIIKDENGLVTSSINIVIATTGGQTIDGSSTITIKVPYTAIAVYSNGTNWSII